MSDAEKGPEVSISVEVPYLSLYDKILIESSSNLDVANKLETLFSKKNNWDEFLVEQQQDERARELTLISIPRTAESEPLLMSLLIFSSSNTFFNTKKDVLFTGTRAYTNLSLLRSVWELSGNKEMIKEFNPISMLEQKGFIDTVNALSSSPSSIIAVGDEISYLHGLFSKDTWNILGGIVSKPITVKMHKSDITGESPLLGTMVLIGDALEALFSVVTRMSTFDIPHVQEDMKKIQESFASGGRDEKNKKLPNNED
jgi:hypothetical protein